VTETAAPSATPFLGLAPFLRMSLQGQDLVAHTQQLLDQAQSALDDAPLWMNLSTAMMCIGQRDLGLKVQGKVLELQRVFRIAPATTPGLRVLMLMAPGDLAENTPLDCLLEGSDIELIYCYLSEDGALPEPVPAHDLVVVGPSESAESRPYLAPLAHRLANWPTPVINRPEAIPNTGRAIAARLLQDAPGVLMPPTEAIERHRLEAVAAGREALPAPLAMPLIVRPVGSQAGRDLARIADAGELADYLRGVAADTFFVAPFIDYSGADGLFRKYRVALIDGAPYPSHMGVSQHWMIHYLNAGMYEDAAKRAEEAHFMDAFDAFAERHAAAFEAIHARIGLDYLCIDCAESRDGRLLIFEVDHVMVVHAMDPVELFPYKQLHMARVREAMRAYLLKRAAEGSRP